MVADWLSVVKSKVEKVGCGVESGEWEVESRVGVKKEGRKLGKVTFLHASYQVVHQPPACYILELLKSIIFENI